MTTRSATRRVAAQFNPTALATLRASLVAELDVQRAQLAEHQATFAELTGQSDVDSILEREIAERGNARAVDAIADIEDAIARIDDSTYGTCEQCGSDIALERLEAIPQTRHCVACPAPGSAR